ncbi:MAG: hypothetical protein K5668_03055 [Lachnospiraceae bacterium]|nr:hypothetical protein [Lachnospiraceae bacterium]
MPDTDDLIVGGYHFHSTADADKARDEQKKIAYIEAHMNRDNPESVLTIYEKMLSNRIFVTPVGFGFLKEVRDYLLASESIDNDRIKPLELNQMYSLGKGISEDNELPQRKIIPAKKKNPYEERFFISAVFNVVLVIAVIAMFIIATTSDNPNIINYENNIVNKYSEWEEELKDREQRVRDAERELGLENTENGTDNN